MTKVRAFLTKILGSQVLLVVAALPRWVNRERFLEPADRDIKLLTVRPVSPKNCDLGLRIGLTTRAVWGKITKTIKSSSFTARTTNQMGNPGSSKKNSRIYRVRPKNRLCGWLLIVV
jgi:hypothetical protein